MSMPSLCFSATLSKYTRSGSNDQPYLPGDNTSPWCMPTSPLATALEKPCLTRTRIVLFTSMACKKLKSRLVSEIPIDS